MATMNVADFSGSSTSIEKPLAPGRAAAGSSRPVTLSDEDFLVGTEYETVAASQTDQPIGATGAAGDRLTGLLVVPATTSPGAVSIKDGGGSAITVFTGGASSVATLIPFFIPLNLISLAGAWSVTTGANVSVLAAGNFT